jgi:hypothetical protein
MTSLRNMGGAAALDGIFSSDLSWKRAAPQAVPSRAPWPFIAMVVVFATFSIIAAVAYPEVFAAGLSQF